MIELLRNCSHGSEIATYLVENPDRKRVRKVAWTPEGITNLQAEAQGWAWYAHHRPGSQRTYCCSQIKTGGLAIDIDWIEGQKGDFTKGLIVNYPIVEAALHHYVAVWQDASGDLVPLHGDFSIDNIILNGDGVYVIDWEHFRTDAVPWGFDSVYLLFETLWFGIRNKRAPSPREMMLLTKGIAILAQTGRLSETFHQAPLKTLIQFIRSHPDLWGKQLAAFPGKLPVLNYSEKQIAMIDQWLKDYRARR